MPIALDPTQTIKIILETDQDKANPPTFIYRVLTYRQYGQLSDTWQKILNAGKLVNQIKKKLAHRSDSHSAADTDDADLKELQQQMPAQLETAEDLGTRIVRAAGDNLIGWENMVGPHGPITFKTETLVDICTAAELMELIEKQLSGSVAGAEDKKKLESPSPAGTAASVTTAQESPDV